MWLSQQTEKAGDGSGRSTFCPEFLGSHCHPPFVLTVGHHSSPESHPRGGSRDPGLYNLPVTEQLEPKATEDESAAAVANRTLRLGFHHFDRQTLSKGEPENSLGQTWASVPASVWRRQVSSLLTVLGRALGQALALLGERR